MDIAKQAATTAIDFNLLTPEYLVAVCNRGCNLHAQFSWLLQVVAGLVEPMF
jgi:hypothetical protein